MKEKVKLLLSNIAEVRRLKKIARKANDGDKEAIIECDRHPLIERSLRWKHKRHVPHYSVK